MEPVWLCGLARRTKGSFESREVMTTFISSACMEPVNDIGNALNDSKYILYADDTSLTSGDVDLIKAKQIIQGDLKGINSWFCANKSKVNKDKTQFIVFGKKGMLLTVENDNLYITFGNQRIWSQTEVLYLGVTLDKKLSFKPHVSNVSKKISKHLGILSNIKHLLTASIRKQVYSALIFPHVHYCSSVWSCCSHTELLRLHVLLNRACTCVLNIKDVREHVQPLYNRLQWLTCFQIFQLNFAIDAFKILHNIYSIHINLPPLALDLQQYDTRNRSCFRLPDLRTDIERRQLRYKLPYFLNNLTSEITVNTTLTAFKKSYKKFVVSAQ